MGEKGGATEKIIQVLSGSCILVVFQIPKELSSRCCALLGCCPSPLKPILAYVVSGARLRQRLYCRYMKEVTSRSDLSFLDAIFLTRPIGQGCEDSLKHERRRANLPSSSGTQGCEEIECTPARKSINPYRSPCFITYIPVCFFPCDPLPTCPYTTCAIAIAVACMSASIIRRTLMWMIHAGHEKQRFPLQRDESFLRNRDNI